MAVEIYWSTKLRSASQEELWCMELDVLYVHWTPNNNCSRYSAVEYQQKWRVRIVQLRDIYPWWWDARVKGTHLWHYCCHASRQAWPSPPCILVLLCPPPIQIKHLSSARQRLGSAATGRFNVPTCRKLQFVCPMNLLWQDPLIHDLCKLIYISCAQTDTSVPN